MIEVKPLNYNFDALKPVVGSETMLFHHDKHYVGYVTKANELLPPKWTHKDLEEIVSLAREQGNTMLFNQVAQVWNHEFFFEGLSLLPSDKGISGALIDLIQQDFQNVENLETELVKAAMARCGSGWVWLLLNEGHLKIQTTLNAETPCGMKQFKPLWTLDVWEHAYYLDYQNRRLDYATEVVNRAMNWRLVGERLSL